MSRPLRRLSDRTKDKGTVAVSDWTTTRMSGKLGSTTVATVVAVGHTEQGDLFVVKEKQFRLEGVNAQWLSIGVRQCQLDESKQSTYRTQERLAQCLNLKIEDAQAKHPALDISASGSCYYIDTEFREFQPGIDESIPVASRQLSNLLVYAAIIGTHE